MCASFRLRDAANLNRGEGDVVEDSPMGKQVERLEDHADIRAKRRELSTLRGKR
jgi:hypothetical protein